LYGIASDKYLLWMANLFIGTQSPYLTMIADKALVVSNVLKVG